MRARKNTFLWQGGLNTDVTQTQVAGFGALQRLHILCLDAPKYRNGKIVSGSRRLGGEAMGMLAAHSPGAVLTQGAFNIQAVKKEYLAWATEEFVFGRNQRALAVSSATQVFSTISRFVEHVESSGAMPSPNCACGHSRMAVHTSFHFVSH